MKAIHVTAYGGPENMILAEAERPVPAAGEVLIKVKAASVNFADIKTRYGKKGGGPLPYIPGIDCTGTIEALGNGVEGLIPGQRVIAFPSKGSYAEYALAPAMLTFPIPKSISDIQAAACPIAGITSLKLLEDIARIQQGETVLVHAGAGGVGTTAIQLARILGAGKVITTAGSPEKTAYALEAGSDYGVCYTIEDFPAKVMEWTEGKGADVILDSVAGTVTEKSLDCLAPFGRLVNFGNASGNAGTVETNDLHSSCRSLLGFSFGTVRKKRPHLVRASAGKIIGLLETGRLSMKIGETFSLSEAAEAHTRIESRQSLGKTVLIID
ncbi:quinone oxidoreductase family protein [Bacillus sp. UMB0728]|uniref:quinone oxidoreductase family protein n=1 Tax=Bacillus sp. UMB0728 TaxID=2066052 RepID=UPI000C768478|nr:zinc-binding dehydrogenase [Bacillus sp. UMB0728]PLR74645.1 quinone oxidoreductase [Bacillus sp. UMB0728]